MTVRFGGHRLLGWGRFAVARGYDGGCCCAARRQSGPQSPAVKRYLLLTLLCGSLAGPVTLPASTVVEILPSIDQGLEDNFNDGIFDVVLADGNNFLWTNASSNGGSQVGFELRAVMEFNLTPARALGLHLSAASLIVYVDGTMTPPGVTELALDLLGYAGDGAVTLADATASDTKIGGLGILAGFPGFGQHSVLLDRDFLGSILAGSDYLGILTRSQLDAGGISIRSSESFGAIGRPTLRLTFDVPEPGSLGLVTFAGVMLLTIRLRRRRPEDIHDGTCGDGGR